MYNISDDKLTASSHYTEHAGLEAEFSRLNLQRGEGGSMGSWSVASESIDDLGNQWLQVSMCVMLQ